MMVGASHRRAPFVDFVRVDPTAFSTSDRLAWPRRSFSSAAPLRHWRCPFPRRPEYDWSAVRIYPRFLRRRVRGAEIPAPCVPASNAAHERSTVNGQQSRQCATEQAVHCLEALGLEQTGEVEVGGGHLAVGHRPANLVEGRLNVRLRVQ
eukprot:902105-Prorocentrum_minimum.AAC.1